MASLETQIMSLLEQSGSIKSTQLDCSLTDLHALLMSMSSKEQVKYSIESVNQRSLTEEGSKIAKKGSGEYNLVKKLQGLKMVTAEEVTDKISLRHAFKNRWIESVDDQLKVLSVPEEDIIQKQLQKLDDLDEKVFKDLKKRKLVEFKKSNIYTIVKGDKFGDSTTFITEITVENLTKINTGDLKPYNFDTVGTLPLPGSIHPIMKVKSEFKNIFLEMGFSEMETNQYIENSFWNFDSLFQPQNHPSRESQDTFFLEKPEIDTLSSVDPEYIKRVNDIHSSTNINDKSSEYTHCLSLGHRNPWKLQDAQKNILRTHTTAVSSRMLYKLAQENLKKDPKDRNYNCKLFSIDKVFRNETVDATHLAEFHQVEGVVAGKGLGLRELMNVIEVFFHKLGMTQIKFKPAFNPYTEPSMEIFGFHQGLKRWIELGNSGVFRPEMLLPMGFPEDVTVIAWGLSLERPAMIKFGLNNIRELVGHKVDVNFIRESPVVFMNK